MPQIPLGEIGQQIQSGQAVEAVDTRDANMMGRAVANLGRAIGELRAENNESLLDAAAEVYEQRLRLAALKEQETYKSTDNTGTGFAVHLQPIKQQIEGELQKEFGFINSASWIKRRARKENGLLPEFMANEAKFAVEENKKIRDLQVATRADKIFNSKDPRAEFMAITKENIRDVENDIASGKLIGEQRDVAIAERHEQTLDALTEKYVAQDNFDEALSFLDASREFLVGDKFQKRRDDLLKRRADFYNETEKELARNEKLNERMLKERGESIGRVLSEEILKAGNDPKKRMEVDKKAAAYLADPTAGYTREMHKSVMNMTSEKSELMNTTYMIDLEAKVSSGRMTPAQAARNLEIEAPKKGISRDTILKGIQRFGDMERRGREQRLNRASTAQVQATQAFQKTFQEEIEATVKNTRWAVVNPKAADQLVSRINRKFAEKALDNPSFKLTGSQIMREAEQMSKETGIPFDRQLFVEPTGAGGPSEINNLKRQLQQYQNKLTDPNLSKNDRARIISEAKKTRADLDNLMSKQRRQP